jgi:hypothetical protein
MSSNIAEQVFGVRRVTSLRNISKVDLVLGAVPRYND